MPVTEVIGDRVFLPIYDPRVQPSDDGSSGMWWRSFTMPGTTSADAFFTPVRANREGSNLWPGTHLPDDMFASGQLGMDEHGWMAFIRQFYIQGTSEGAGFSLSRLHLRFSKTVPLVRGPGEGPQAEGLAGPFFDQTVQDSLYVAFGYRDRSLAIKVPRTQRDPMEFDMTAEERRWFINVLVALQEDTLNGTRGQFCTAFLNGASDRVLIPFPRTPLVAVDAARQVQVGWTAKFDDTDASPSVEEIRRWWSGEGDVTADDIEEGSSGTYRGTRYGDGMLMRFVNTVSTGFYPEGKLSVQIAVGKASIRHAMARDWGPIKVGLGWIYSLDFGQTWTRIRRSFTGRLGRTELRGEVFQGEIESLISNIDRDNPLIWSHANQKRMYPDDDAFEQASELAGAVDLRWPPGRNK